MEEPTRPHCWEELPVEILLQIISYLEPSTLPRLQLVSRRLRHVCLDNKLWKQHCFDQSLWFRFLKGRRRAKIAANKLEQDSQGTTTMPGPAADEPTLYSATLQQKRQDLANWDPVFPGERISWYDEYIQRHGPPCVNWLQAPRIREGCTETLTEARGMALFRPNNGDDGLGTTLAVSPLDDGSVCLWDVNGNRTTRGGILAKSRPGILFIDGPDGSTNSKRSKKIDTGVTECVSVNNNGHKAFFAVQSHLLEVDLNRLDVVSRESFEWSITTLSPIHDGVPLTVGTSLGIHLHDFRERARVQHESMEQVDQPGWDAQSPFRGIFDTKPLPPYASLSQPTPISILHLPQWGSENAVSDDIYVAGRFSNILHYDRRQFPRIMGSIYSGARLSSLAALPYPFFQGSTEARRMGNLPVETIEEWKSAKDGRTLIAGGEYNTKGSLELYGLSSASHQDGNQVLQKGLWKNRQNAASSIILSVANHGSRIAFSDGAGFIKWFERDGSTECRRIRIGNSEPVQGSSLFNSMPGSEDMARKIVSTKGGQDIQRRNEDNLLFWTGEKLGMVSFTGKLLFTSNDFGAQSSEETEDERARTEYARTMRKALKRQADEVRFVRGLGNGRRPH